MLTASVVRTLKDTALMCGTLGAQGNGASAPKVWAGL